MTFYHKIGKIGRMIKAKWRIRCNPYVVKKTTLQLQACLASTAPGEIRPMHP